VRTQRRAFREGRGEDRKTIFVEEKAEKRKMSIQRREAREQKDRHSEEGEEKTGGLDSGK
jgi:hypothetical protein